MGATSLMPPTRSSPAKGTLVSNPRCQAWGFAVVGEVRGIVARVWARSLGRGGIEAVALSPALPPPRRAQHRDPTRAWPWSSLITKPPRSRGDHRPLASPVRQNRLPRAQRLLICADGGHRYRICAWKFELDATSSPPIQGSPAPKWQLCPSPPRFSWRIELSPQTHQTVMTAVVNLQAYTEAVLEPRICLPSQ
ncbi:hypothetical protein JOF47_000291 [Paeniglutamicibacter kerguelensis]|uniref:Uncharacterized protein n=1 Tax=Paeniglutamicibacter kerguelensis TaxID=254788 RepID=A0ABS4X8I2_9MICC|nr:hypothetical protein [Paeniglutamicibacter kerguelensis]